MLVTGLVAVAAGVLVFITVASASSPEDLGPKVTVPSEPTAPDGGSGSDDGATKVPGPSPSTAGGEEDDDNDDAGEDGSDDADDDADD